MVNVNPGPGRRAAHHTVSRAGSQSILCSFWKCNHDVMGSKAFINKWIVKVR